MDVLNQRVQLFRDAWSRYAPLATSRREKASVAAYILKFAAAHQLPARLRQPDTKIHLQGATYIVGLGSGEMGIFEELYRDHIYDRVADFIPRAGWIVLDIGANVGLFTIKQARRGARVLSFEPNPDCYRRLSRAIVENELTGRVSIFNYAVGATPGLGVLRIPDVMVSRATASATVLGSVVLNADTNSIPSSSVSVRVTSLDRIIPALGVEHIELLKIDVEGAEVEVLQGAEHTLRTVQRIIIEYHSQELREQISGLLRDYGFEQVLQLASNYNGTDAGLVYFGRDLG